METITINIAYYVKLGSGGKWPIPAYKAELSV